MIREIPIEPNSKASKEVARLLALRDFEEIVKNMKDADPDFTKVVDDNFWDLIVRNRTY